MLPVISYQLHNSSTDGGFTILISSVIVPSFNETPQRGQTLIPGVNTAITVSSLSSSAKIARVGRTFLDRGRRSCRLPFNRDNTCILRHVDAKLHTVGRSSAQATVKAGFALVLACDIFQT